MVHGVGIEVVSVERFRAAMNRRGSKFLRRLFTAPELEYCFGKRHPELHLSARFAAKRSLFKALGHSLGYSKVEVMRADSGAPALRVEGSALEGLRCSLSMAHSKEYSMAETVVEVVE